VRPARTALGASGRRVTVDGVSLAFDEEGTGADVVCLHAIGHGAADFVSLRRRLRERYRVLALDWPGQGTSGDDHVPASAVRYTALLEGFSAQRGRRVRSSSATRSGAPRRSDMPRSIPIGRAPSYSRIPVGWPPPTTG